MTNVLTKYPHFKKLQQIDTNEFRRTRLYSREMEEQLCMYWELMQATHKVCQPGLFMGAVVADGRSCY